MRKQYHSRNIDGDEHIWDVHNLVEQSKNIPVQEVPLESIQELDENFWFQGEENVPTGRAIAEHIKLIEETDLKYPIILCQDGKLMDGMHRVVKAYLLRNEFIKAVRFPKNPEPDYMNVDVNDLEY